MNGLLRVCLAVLAAMPFVLARAAEAETMMLDVEFKLTDPDYQPLAGVPVRLVLGVRRLAGARRRCPDRHRQ